MFVLGGTLAASALTASAASEERGSTASRRLMGLMLMSFLANKRGLALLPGLTSDLRSFVLQPRIVFFFLPTLPEKQPGGKMKSRMNRHERRLIVCLQFLPLKKGEKRRSAPHLLRDPINTQTLLLLLSTKAKESRFTFFFFTFLKCLNSTS